jgi:Flp pilus assembly protein protease CpaA
VSNRTIIAAQAVLTACADLAFGYPLALALVLALAAAASATDALTFTIPNRLALVTAVAALVAFAGAGAPVPAILAAAIIGVLLLIGFELDVMGGGDVKLLPSLALAAASVGDPALLWPRLTTFALVLCSTAVLWALAHGHKQAPLAVGGPLALAAALA